MNSDEREKRNNTRRLACALAARQGDAGFIQQLARMLHYLPEQLSQDIGDLDAYTAETVRADFEADSD